MSILDRLKEACNGTPAKIPWPHRLLHDAIKEIEDCHKNINTKADFIEATINDMAHIDSRMSDLQADNDRLMDALEPFSKEAGWWFEKGYNIDEMPVEGFGDYDGVMTCGDLFRARQVFAPLQADKQEGSND